MNNSVFLALRYLLHHRVTSVVLIASISMIIYLPAAMQVIVASGERHFRSRAESTPLIIGPRGSALDLVLGSVYFDKPHEQVTRFQQCKRVEEQKLGTPIPLHLKFAARNCQVVGTTNNYLRFRNLELEKGRHWDMLGECVIGAGVVDRLDVDVGDWIPVSIPTAFLLDSPPLRLQIVGICARTETPDDDAIFVDLDTTWVIEGLGHGHAQGAQHGASETAPYTTITRQNVKSFHFHGNRNEFPITAMIVIPDSTKAQTLLLGQYFSPDETVQIVRPRDVMESLLKRVVMIRSYLIAIIAVISFVTILTMSLVFVLSIRLRRAEIVTMSKIGCSRNGMLFILGGQIIIILSAGGSVAATLTIATYAYGPELARTFIF